MDKTDLIQQLTQLFRDQLDNDSLTLSPETTAQEVEGWDSLTHIQLVVAIEKKYRIRFASAEINGFRNVGEMCDAILRKVGG